MFYQVLSATLNGFITCSCNHLTSFGGALLIKPNRIDFDKVLVEFKNLQETGIKSCSYCDYLCGSPVLYCRAAYRQKRG